MQVLHVFEEPNEEDWDNHLTYWFGRPEVSKNPRRSEPDVVCYCGGRLVVLSLEKHDPSSIAVAVVWHKLAYPEI